MTVTTRAPRSRPPGAPAYYLARPADAWIAALHRRPPRRLPGSGAGFPPERSTR